MPILSDRWIRKAALEQKMIEPFVEAQKREGVISYGLSSYGYDARVSDEFKIFTNVDSAIVDPKDFNPKGFVDRKTDICVIPPNSFALARTVEYFRIPRDVLVICLGKSTYARCFRGDTRVALVDGTSESLERLAARGQPTFGYSLAAHGRIVVTLLDTPRFVGRDSLIEITLDNGQLIHCTPDHVFILRDGQVAQAGELKPGHSLMPLYRQLIRGYEAVYQPLNGHLIPTHRLADEWNLRNRIYPDRPGTHRHHVDHDRRNNMPWNIERMPASDHIRLHNGETYGPDFDPEEHGLAIRQALAARAEDQTWRENYARKQSLRAQDFWHDEAYAQARAALIEKHLASWTPARRELQRERMQRQYALPGAREAWSEKMREAWRGDAGDRRERQREIARKINLRAEIDEAALRAALDQAGSIRGAARILNCDRAVFRRFPAAISEFRGTPGRNHSVASVRALPGDHDVYCLTVPEAGNFALEAGVFVENCGIIVNVTPLEPEWEGHVTLEFSNTTPLPARIYANEGACQFLFLKGEEPCETSYRDRAGKYMGQRGVTLPKL